MHLDAFRKVRLGAALRGGGLQYVPFLERKRVSPHVIRHTTAINPLPGPGTERSAEGGHRPESVAEGTVKRPPGEKKCELEKI